MAGYADALASVLYPNTAQDSLYTLGGKSVLGIQQPMYEKPWQNALASGLQNALGYGLQAYGTYSANKANAENAAAMVPQLSQMGINVSPQVAEGLQSENPQMRQLALALTQSQMEQQAAGASAKADIEKFRLQEDIKAQNAQRLKQMELDALKAEKSKGAEDSKWNEAFTIKKEINALPETKTYKELNATFKAMDKASKVDSKAASLFFKKAFERVSNPNSVVSPGEMEALNNIQGFYDKYKGSLDGFFGGSDLSPAVKAQMVDIARNYRDAVHDTYKTSAQSFIDLAAQRGIDSKDVLTTPFLPEKKPTNAPRSVEFPNAVNISPNSLAETQAENELYTQEQALEKQLPAGLPPASEEWQFRVVNDPVRGQFVARFKKGS